MSSPTAAALWRARSARRPIRGCALRPQALPPQPRCRWRAPRSVGSSTCSLGTDRSAWSSAASSYSTSPSPPRRGGCPALPGEPDHRTSCVVLLQAEPANNALPTVVQLLLHRARRGAEDLRDLGNRSIV